MNTIWDEWKAQKLAYKMAQREAVKNQEPKVYRNMTADEVRKVFRLGSVTCAYASYDQHFIQQLNGCNQETKITDRMGEFIEILWYKYRRQIGHKDPRPEYYESRKS